MTDEAIRNLFRAPELSWIAERLRDRYKRGRPLHSTLVLAAATARQREALDNLLGRRPTSGDSLRVSADLLGEIIDGQDLSRIVYACYGEVTNLRALRDHRENRWRAIFEEARTSFTDDRVGLQWLDSLEAGLLRRVANGDPKVGRDLLTISVAIWKCLPFQGATLAELAGESTGNTHALDRGQPLSTLMLRGLKIGSGHDGNQSAEARRLAWESVGVVVDRLSAPALTFNLYAVSGSGLEKLLWHYRALAQPAYLTRQIVKAEAAFSPLPEPMRQVFIVENPAVVEAAASRLGSRCAPLICTEGRPASAVQHLLAQLAEAGAQLRVHADFDWTGLLIVDQVLRLPNATPWRMDEDTYRAAVGTVPLTGRRCRAEWAGSLTAVMGELGTVVYEEQVLSQLLEDLAL